MKKIRTILFIAVAGLMLMACNSVESTLGKYEKACDEGRFFKAASLAIEIDKVKDKLTPEQTARYEAATEKLNKSTEEKLEKAADAFGKLLEDDDK